MSAAKWLNTVQCMDALDLLRGLPDACVDMIATDMPYGTTACSWDTVIDLDAWWIEAHRITKSHAAIVCTGSQPFTTTLIASNIKRFRYEWVWQKSKATGHLDARRKPLKAHENILVFGGALYFPQLTPGARYKNNHKPGDTGEVYGEVKVYSFDNQGTRFPRSVIEFTHETDPVHPTQKPLALFEYLIRTYTRPGDLVCDPFVGSGTTALAARNTGREFICCEMNYEYVQIARDRLAQSYTPDMFDTLLQEDNTKSVQIPLDFG